MNTNRHISQDDLALFALQLLEGDELRETLDHLEHCEECRHEVARFQGDLVGYALAQSELHTPPAAARERLMKGVAKEKKIVRQAPVAAAPPAVIPMAVTPQESRADVRTESRMENRVADGDVFLAARARRTFATDSAEEEEEATTRRSSSMGAFGWAGWAVAAGLAVTAGLQYRDHQAMQNDLATANVKIEHSSASLAAAQETLQTLTDQGAMQVSLHQMVDGKLEPPKPEGRASYVADKGSLVFIANHLQPLAPYKTYELWLIPADGKDPIPAGTFKPDARGIATVVMPDLPKGIAAKMFGVTIEDDGGSKTPTAPIVLAGM
jgi:hypothetical protein